MHDIEHQITYHGSNFIFHDSQGFESGSTQELNVAWEFIEQRSTKTELKDQLCAIWYLDLLLYIGYLPTFHLGTAYPWTALVPCYLQSYSSLTKEQAEVSPEANCFLCTEFSMYWLLSGSSTVPLVVIFTKFDGQIINEYTDLSDVENTDKWDRARKNAERAFQTVYLPKVFNTDHPPKAFVWLEGNNGEHSLHRI